MRHPSHKAVPKQIREGGRRGGKRTHRDETMAPTGTKAIYFVQKTPRGQMREDIPRVRKDGVSTDPPRKSAPKQIRRKKKTDQNKISVFSINALTRQMSLPAGRSHRRLVVQDGHGYPGAEPLPTDRVQPCYIDATICPQPRGALTTPPQSQQSFQNANPIGAGIPPMRPNNATRTSESELQPEQHSIHRSK